MARSSTLSVSSDLARAVAVQAAASFGGRNATREAFEDGASYECDLELSGQVAKKKVSIPIVGKLTVGHANPTGSTKGPDMKRLLAAALESMSAAKREAFLAAQPEPSEASQAQVASLVARMSTKGPRAGSISFIEALQED